MKGKRSGRGVTLLEVLLGMGLLTLAHVWVIPAIADLVHSMRVYDGAHALAESLMRARSEAILRNGRVVMCKSASGRNCEAGASWGQGWIVFHDANNNALLDEGESLLYREQALSPMLMLGGNGPVSTYVSYTPYGHTKLTSGAFQAGTFTVCSRRDGYKQGRQVIISSGGRPRVAKVTLAQCI